MLANFTRYCYVNSILVTCLIVIFKHINKKDFLLNLFIMKTFLYTNRIYNILSICAVFFAISNISAQEMIQGGSMEANDSNSWTVNFTGESDQYYVAFGDTNTCAKGEGNSLRVSCEGTEYANIIISQEISLIPETEYKVSGAIKDLTGGTLDNWWAQLKLKQGTESPSDENDGIKLIGFNSYLGCLPTDALWSDEACDAYGRNSGESPALIVINSETGAVEKFINFTTPTSTESTIQYQFAILVGAYSDGSTPYPYDVLFDEISLTVVEDEPEPSAIENKNFENKINLVNYPNPCKGETTISYNIPQSSKVKLTIYNMLGKEIACLYNGYKEAGEYSIIFDTSNLNENLFVCKLEIDDKVVSSMLSVLK